MKGNIHWGPRRKGRWWSLKGDGGGGEGGGADGDGSGGGDECMFHGFLKLA